MLLLLQSEAAPPATEPRFQFLLALTTEVSADTEPDPQPEPPFTGGVGRVRRRDIDRILRALRKKKRKPIKILARAVLREIEVLPEKVERNVEELTAPLLTIAGAWKANAEAELEAERAMLERAYAEILAQREAEAARLEAVRRDDDEVVLALWAADQRRLLDVLSRIRLR